LKHPFEVFAPLAGFYFFACLFLPWTLKEAAKVLGILSALGVVAALIYASATWTQFLSLLFLPLAGLPGLGICWLRHSQFVSVQPTTAIASRCEPMRGLEAPLGDLVSVHGQFSKWMYGLRLHQLTKLRQRSGKIFIQSLVVARIGE